MADVFTRTEVNFGGAMHSQFGMMVPNGGLTGVLMQNLTLSYSQNISRIYEIGPSGQPTKVYYIGGRSQGQMSAAHVIGPGPTMLAFYTQFGDVCNAARNTLSLAIGPNICATSTASGAMNYTARYCVLTQIGMAVAAQDFVINENSALMFSGLAITGAGTPAAPATPLATIGSGSTGVPG